MPVLEKKAGDVTEWLDALRDFHAAGDRSHPFKFVGRGTEMAILLRRAQLLRPGASGHGPPKGASPRFAGPPGMGKTALAEEFVYQQQQAGAKPGATTATAVLATLDVLDGPPAHAACRLASRAPLPPPSWSGFCPTRMPACCGVPPRGAVWRLSPPQRRSSCAEATRRLS